MKTVRVTKGYDCGCSQYCKYCGARRSLGRDGHYCPTGGCKQHSHYEHCLIWYRSVGCMGTKLEEK